MNDPLSDVDLRLVQTPDDVDEFRRWLGERRPVLGLDTETGGLHWWRDRLRTVQLGDANTGWCIPHEDWGGLAKWALSEYRHSPIALHNSTFDAMFLVHNGYRIRWHLIDDTMTMSHLLDPAGTHALKPLSVAHVSPNADVGQAALEDGMRRQRWTWDTVPIAFGPYWAYAALDPVVTARLWEKFKPQVDARFGPLYETEMAVSRILTAAQQFGMRIDTQYARAQIDTLRARAEELDTQIRETYGVSPGSNNAIAEILIADGVPLTERTPSGAWKLDKEILAWAASQHELPALVQERKRAIKFSKAYYGNALSLLDDDGILHASINPLGARTGRMSVSNPALQQMPSKDRAVRDMFIPRDENRSILSIDYSNIEVRVLADMSQDETLLRAFANGDDVHMAAARIIYGQDATALQRKYAKTVTFANIYGAGNKKMGAQAGVSEAEAAALRDRYNTLLPGIPDFMAYVQDIGKERFMRERRAYVRTPSGRESSLTEWEARDGQYYKLVNYAIQGFAADLFKTSLVRLDAAGLCDGAFALPVHDELVFDVPADSAAEHGQAAKEIMESVGADFDLSVPLECDVEIMQRWGDSAGH